MLPSVYNAFHENIIKIIYSHVHVISPESKEAFKPRVMYSYLYFYSFLLH